MDFIAELRRRNVLRIGGLYLVAAWLVTQVASTLAPIFDAPAWLPRTVVIVLAIGFLPALIFSWVFEFTPQGLKRESEVDRTRSLAPQTGKLVDRLLLVILALAVGYFAFDKFVLAPERDAALERQKAQAVAEARKEGGVDALIRSYGDRSIAVLPFVNMSSDKEQEYFSDGIAEELINQLTKIPGLRVIARTSSFSYKGKNVTIAQIAKQLNVAHVLEGSVRKSGNRIRLAAQLIRTSDSSDLWSETYDRDLSDIFAVQDEISLEVVRELKIHLLVGLPKARATDPRVFTLYQQGRQYYRLNTPEGYARTLDLYQKALVIDPDYAPAWTGLGLTYLTQVNYGARTAADATRLAREAAAKALAIDPDQGAAYGLLGKISRTYDADFGLAAQNMSRAFALAPQDPDVLSQISVMARALGRLKLATMIGEARVAQDPAMAVNHADLGLTYLFDHRPDLAISATQRALTLSPGYFYGHFQMGLALLQKRQPQAALKEFMAEKDEGWRLIGLPMGYYAVGDRIRSDQALAELIGKFSSDSAYNIAYVYAFRNEPDRVFDWLQKAVATKDAGLSSVAYDQLFENVHKDPRWLPFLKRLGRAPDQLAAIKFDVTP